MATIADDFNMSVETIRDALSGLPRMGSIDVQPDHHHYIVLSLLNQWMADVAAPAASGVLLDYGCGGQPYKELFSRFVTRYIGADVAPAAGIELDLLFQAGKPLDLPDQSVDTILSSQVLEHVADPRAYVAECKRLLRPAGRLIISVPMQFRQHEKPYDYHRFTRFGLERLLQQEDLKILDLRPCGGAFAMLGQILCNTLSVRGVRRKLAYRLINRSALWLDRKYPDYDDTMNWNCIASN